MYTVHTLFVEMSTGAQAATASNNSLPAQNFDFFLVLDFEATCDSATKIVPQEIIEFPVLKINGKTFETETEFHTYVQPTANPRLTPFCTELTGITQDKVDGKPTLQETMKIFEKWMEEQGFLDGRCSFVFVTCGDWDLKTMLPGQCSHFRIHLPQYFKTWINIKRPFSSACGRSKLGMMGMLRELKLTHHGRHHSGIDDCRNIANILKALAERGCIFQPTYRL
ncbi:ERI1 exoribonuclease 3-like isoform X2 [Ptychodera flava]|uniref:ERI1 exoribonuclease 3-like isoform X2 n=1 Tax=Ptychodera flava TaxID=63121 RepID=UPI00396A8589